MTTTGSSCIGLSDCRFCQNSGLDPDFGQEREKKQPRFESETKCREDRIRRLLGLEP